MKEKIESTFTKWIDYHEIIGAKGKDDHEMLIEEKCEYCKEDMESKPISKKYVIETIVDGKFLYNYCDCGLHTVVEIKYCPMCGRKL